MKRSQRFLSIALVLTSLLGFGSTVAVTPSAQSKVALKASPKTIFRNRKPKFSQAPNTLIGKWNAAALTAVRNTQFAPPPTARALAMLNTGMYNAWAICHPSAKFTLGVTFPRPKSRSTCQNEEAISFAAYRILVDLFPTQKTVFNTLMSELGYDPSKTTLRPTTQAGIGNLFAKLILTIRHRDGSNQLGRLGPTKLPYSDYTGYKPANTPTNLANPSRWQPLLAPDASGNLVEQKFLVPHWNRVIPFALKQRSQFRPKKGPAKFGQAEYTAQAQAIYALSQNLTPTQQLIAKYWANGPGSETPPGQWILFGLEISNRDKHTLDQDVKMFFPLSNAVFDAGIAAWDAKIAYDSVRPISAIRLLIDPTWNSFIPTPPFAEFVSGHSTFSAAAAEVLTQFTGSTVFGSQFQDSVTGITLSWPTFLNAANQAGISRLYGGIHFEDGDLVGRAIGKKVGAQAWQKAKALFGTP
jgi:hypothetical protein